MSAVGRLLSSRAVPLRRLDLSYNGITSKDVEVLCGALRTNRTLNTLNLEGNPAEGSGALVGAIASLESLTCITLTPEVEIAGLGMADSGRKSRHALATGLASVCRPTGLASVCLSPHRARQPNRRTSHLFVHEFDAGKPALIEALSCPDRSRLLSTLSVLTLPGGLISNGEEEAAVFARAITSHAWLDKLVVRDIGYSPDLRPRLATQDVELPIGALRRNELVLLDLSRKRLGPRLAILLAA
eukprot:gene9341-11069_t